MTTPAIRLTTATVFLAAVVWLAPWPAVSGATDVRPPKLTYERIELANGLTVLLHQDRSTPIAHVQLWYHVGSKDERPGRTGFAHLFEHMMFKGSKNVEPEQHTSIVSSVGGRANAYTTEDATVYWQTVPSQYLPLVLWMEADRMATLRIDEGTFANEREVVKEERRMRIENQPYGRLNEILFQQAFTVHPYRHPVIGSMQDLEAATIEDVRDFYRTYYVPSNLTIVIAGDFEIPQAKELVERYLARVPPAAKPVPRDIPKEPIPTKEKRVTVTEPWPLPAVVVAHHITYDGHPDGYPLHIVSKVLSDGQSSRIYRKLVYETGLALTAFGGGNIIEHPNLFFTVAIVNPGQSPEAVEKALLASCSGRRISSRATTSWAVSLCRIRPATWRMPR
jgi:zinc protease